MQLINLFKKEVLNNKVLRKQYENTFCVITIKAAGNIEKYIAKDYFRKNKFKYTVLLQKAWRFDSEEQATRFLQNLGNETEPMIRRGIIKYCIA